MFFPPAAISLSKLKLFRHFYILVSNIDFFCFKLFDKKKLQKGIFEILLWTVIDENLTDDDNRSNSPNSPDWPMGICLAMTTVTISVLLWMGGA